MLVDEVLAVGDAAFAQKCMDVFHERRAAGKTIVLVTHDMATVQSLCHRAMLVHDGEVRYVGEPEDAALRYYRLNFADSGAPAPEPTPGEAVLDVNARVVHAALRDPAGAAVRTVEEGTPIVLDVVLEAARDLDRPIFLLQVRNADGVVVFGFERTLVDRLAPGGRVRLAGQIENRLSPGSYSLDCWVRQDRESSGMAVQGMRLVHFHVYGTGAGHGVVELEADVEPIALEDPPW
jgi:hypothetical protein